MWPWLLIVAVFVAFVAWLLFLGWRDTHPGADVAIDDHHELPEVRGSWLWQIRRETGDEEAVDHEVRLFDRARQQVTARFGRRPRP